MRGLQIRLFSNLGEGIAPLLQRIDLMNQLNPAGPAPRDVFNEAHKQELFLRNVNDHCRNLDLAQKLKGFVTTLSAHEVEFIASSLPGLISQRPMNSTLSEKFCNTSFDHILSARLPVPTMATRIFAPGDNVCATVSRGFNSIDPATAAPDAAIKFLLDIGFDILLRFILYINSVNLTQ